MTSGFRKLLTLSASAAVLVVAASAANASSFAIRAGQSAEGLGMAFAGAASGGIGMGSQAWNPATITMMPGRTSNWNATYLAALAKYGNVTTLPANTNGPSDNLGINGAFLPASYNVWQLTDRLFVGLSNTAPFGLRSKPGGSDGIWAGQQYGRSATIRTVNIAPSVAYAFNDWISFGAALQLQYMHVDQKQALGSAIAGPLSTSLQLRGDSYDFGYRLGMTIRPTASTTIGLAYRSEINQTIRGFARTVPPILNGATNFARVGVNLPTPASAVLGVSHRFNDQWQAHLGVEWTNWSRLKNFAITNLNTGTQLTTNAAPAFLRFNYKDSWFASLGVEYSWNRDLTLRAGLGYEWSAVDDVSRSVFISDNDRLWLSTGLTYKLSDKLTFDAGYTFIAVNTARINYTGGAAGTPSPGGLVLQATAKPTIHIVSVGLTYRWDDPAVAQPVVSKSAGPISVRN